MTLKALLKNEKVAGWIRTGQVKLLTGTGGYKPQIAARIGF